MAKDTDTDLEEEKEEVSEEDLEDEEVEDASLEELEDENEIKLFDRWSFKGIEVDDLSLQDYINIEPIIIPHTGGKHSKKKFWKTEHISIVERFINKLLAPGLVKKRIKGRGPSLVAGKKRKAINIVYHAFELIEHVSAEKPINILVKAIENAAPREETTQISMGGISYQKAVDVSPQRRVDLALKLIVQSIYARAYNNIKTIDEIVAEEFILAARNDHNSRAIKRKDEIERVAISAR